MVTASKAMSAGQAGTYFNKDNYYIKDGITEKGQWSGKAAEELGLKGNVNQKDFVEVLNGYKPGSLTNEQLKTLEGINKIEGSLQTDAKKIAKMPEGDEKIKLKEALDVKIKAYNKTRLDFHKDVKTGGLHSQLKELKALKTKDHENQKQIREISKEISAIYKDPNSPQLIKDGKDDFGIATHRAGFDFTMSAPKSVSVMALVAGDEKLIDAHHAATAKAMGYMEKNFAQTRESGGDRARVNTEKLAAAQFTHYTSRATEKGAAPDPQLHTHNLILNLTKNGEGWASLEPQQLYAAQKLAGQIYQNELARGVKEAGYAVEWDKSGGNYTFEIKGVDKNLRDGYSSRTGQIEAIVLAKEKEMGRSLSAEEKNNITLDSRAHKDEQNIDKLREDWKESLLDMGHTKESLIEATKNQTNDKTISSDATAAVKQAVENLHTQKAVFSEHELSHEALKAAQGSASIEEIRAAIKVNEKELLIEKTDTFKVGVDKNNSETALYSSKEILKSEANIEKAVTGGKNTGAIMSQEDFAKHFETIETKKISEAETNGKEYHTLTEGQRSALGHIATSNHKYIGIQGDAGSGKTTALERMTQMAEILKQVGSDHIELIGLAPTGKAAGNIEKDAGIKSRTIDSFIHKPDEATEGKQQIYLVDESSMLDTVKMEKLMQIAEKTGAKVVFIGDVKQLKPVGAGAMFDRLQKTGQMEFAHVTEVLRQKTEITKEVVTAFKNIETLASGLDRLEKAGNIVQAKDGNMTPVREQFVSNVAADYIAGHEASKLQKNDRPVGLKDGMDSVGALVSTNDDRHEFNEKIRDKLVEAGAVSADGQKHKVLEAKRLDKIDAKFAGSYKIGDVLVSNKNQGGIKGGMRVNVTGVNREDNTIKLSYTTRGGVENEKWMEASKAEGFSAYSQVEKEFAMGDKIAFEKNDKKLGTKNGETGIIKSIDESGSWQVDKEGSMITLDPKEYPFVSHGYAMTVHKSQGQSIDRVHIYADSSKGGLNTNAGYVQMSRAKEELTVYTDSREKLEGQYKQEQISENVGDYRDIKQFSDEKVEPVIPSVSHDFDDPKGVEAPKFEPIDRTMSAEEQFEEEAARKAKIEQQSIDANIKTMRVDSALSDAQAQENWKASKGIDQTSQTRSHHIFYAGRAGATAKDLKGGIRYQQLLKVEAKIMERGSIDLKSSRDFLEKKGFENPQAKAGFLGSQARQQEHLEKMVDHGILVKDSKNEEKYHLAVSRRDFIDYRESERAHDSRCDIARGQWNKALGDKHFTMARSKTDAALIAGGKWNPKEGIKQIKSAGLYTKDMEEVFNRLSARYERMAADGLVKKSGGSYIAVDKAQLKSFVGSREDKTGSYRGEGESSQQWREMQKSEQKTSFFKSSGRLDDAIKHATHVNVHVLSKDIQNSYKSASKMIGAKSVFGMAGAGVIGIVLGTAKTLARGAIGAVYSLSKEAVKGAAKMIEDNNSAKGIERGKLEIGPEKSFEDKLKAAQRGDNEFSPSKSFEDKLSDILGNKEKDGSKSNDPEDRLSFFERLNVAKGQDKDDRSEKADSNGDKEDSKESSSGGKEKEAEREEKERD
jgi:conjugative relaxase-like TrwC/TraI family protein